MGGLREEIGMVITWKLREGASWGYSSNLWQGDPGCLVLVWTGKGGQGVAGSVNWIQLLLWRGIAAAE